MQFQKDSEFVCICDWDESLYQKSLEWVEGSKRVALISNEERQSADSRVQIYHLESPLQTDWIAKKVAWSAVLKKMELIGSGPFIEKIHQYHLAANAILSDAADYWIKPLKNARANDLPYRSGMGLKGVFSEIPALIVGAGPSLQKNGHLIKEFEDKALIFAGGSALNSIDLEPHFAASIDPSAPFRQFKMHSFFETPFCYQSRMNADIFSLIHGEKIHFPDSAIDAINWIYGEDSFDGGWTVGNFLTEVAITFGCSPIFFIGMDLCYENGRKYAKIEVDSPQELVQLGEVLTQKDWLLAAEWTLGKRAKMYDLSRGILKVPKIDIDSALNMCKVQGDLKELVHQAIQKLPLKKGGRWDEWEASFKRCKNTEFLEEEIVYQKLLKPLWEIWRPIFERENQNLELHQKLFFQKVIEEHETFVLSKR